MHDDILCIQSTIVNFYVLRDSKGLYLIDTGFIGGRRILKKALIRRGWETLPIVGIIITHGHLDHILNVHRLSLEYGAWIAAPRLDELYYHGSEPHHGLARIIGSLEALGRAIFRFRTFTPDRYLEEGDELDVGSGLMVISLPGHTAGHCGLYSAQHKLLFSGDLFASLPKRSHLPPRLFNHDTERAKRSIAQALNLELTGVYPNHGDCASPQVHLERLRLLAQGIR